MVPALRALRQHYPEAQIHVLVAAEAYPAIAHIPWIDKIWKLDRKRGKLRLNKSLPLIRALRSEQFDASVDFVGNDRGAIFSRIIGAKKRLGVRLQIGHYVRRIAYTETIEELDTTRHEVLRDYYVLTPWKVPPPDHYHLELYADPALANEAKQLLPKDTTICHLSTSQRKKEWPLNNWVSLAKLIEKAGGQVTFTSGPSPREQQLLKDIQKLKPELHCLDKTPSLALYMAILSRAKLFISPDTAPLHIAAGLGVPTIGIFGPTAASRWAPIGKKHRSITSGLCPCSGHLEQCAYKNRCINAISAQDVFALYKTKPKLLE